MNKTSPFWDVSKDGKTTISHSRLIEFLRNRGFAKVRLSETNTMFVRISNNRVSQISSEDVAECLQHYLTVENKQADVYELIARGVSTYTSPSKLSLLPTITKPNDRDSKESSKFFFNNGFCIADAKGVTSYGYSSLKNPIWENRIIKFDYTPSANKAAGQFENFCRNITGTDKRFDQLKAIIGYLLHRNKDVGESKAIVLYDRAMGTASEGAHGGTGKTLLGRAIAKMREVVEYDGKEIKSGSFFKYQRIKVTTDVIVFDDLLKGTNFESFFTLITSDLEVEKKRQDAFSIPHAESPKVLITSNYVVKGPQGSSSERRKYEFSVENHYSKDHTPEKDFGNRFFEAGWSDAEWNAFYTFMMECASIYLRIGLPEVNDPGLASQMVASATTPEFLEFATQNINFGQWYNKQQIEELYREFAPQESNISPHRFFKQLKIYGDSHNADLTTRKTGGAYSFIIERKPNDGNSVQSN